MRKRTQRKLLGLRVEQTVADTLISLSERVCASQTQTLERAIEFYAAMGVEFDRDWIDENKRRLSEYKTQRRDRG